MRQKIEDFCRSAPDPSKAFNEAFKLISPERLFQKSNTFISNNILFVDPYETIRLIPSGTSFQNISQIISMLYNLLLQRNEALDIQISAAQSLAVDADYRLSRVRSNFCTIDSNTTCEGCKQLIGKNQFYLAPQPVGANAKQEQFVYHKQCIPDQFGTK